MPQELTDRVLERLGFHERPEATLEGLNAIYWAWCRRVPFDNVQKMIHLHTNAAGPLPGDDAESFFHAWLAHGTGGTCWAGNGGLHALVVSLGYSAVRGIGTMVTSPNVPPNHGTVLVHLDGERYMVDASILHGSALRLDEQEITRVAHPVWGVRCERRDGRWHIAWRPLHTPTGIDCRIERLEASRVEFQEAHERTRAWSPFNYAVSARLIRGDAVVGAAFGQRISIDGSGMIVHEPIDRQTRDQVLIEQIGLSEEIVSQLPPDRETPPPPDFMRGALQGNTLTG
jgi:N-hydroxyarylamine O-acetyltransferase